MIFMTILVKIVNLLYTQNGLVKYDKYVQDNDSLQCLFKVCTTFSLWLNLVFLFLFLSGRLDEVGFGFVRDSDGLHLVNEFLSTASVSMLPSLLATIKRLG